MIGVVIALTLLPAMPRHADGEEVLKLLVFGCAGERPAPAAEKDPAVSARLKQFEDRCDAFKARTPEPPKGSDVAMAANARWQYAQRLFAVAGGDAAAEATQYATALRPCYEWEGFPDCPEREAVFADDYLTAHPTSAFASFLPLLSAHRWLCAAEADEGSIRSGKPTKQTAMVHARQTYAARLLTARASPDPLVRFAADTLEETGACR